MPRQVVSSARGYGLLLLGDTEAARAVAAKTLAESRHAGDALTESLAIGLEAQAYLVDGRLADAGRCYERAAAAGTVAGEPLPSVALVHVQLAEVRREQDELDAAERLLQTAIAACEKALGLPEWVFEGNVTLARVLTARGDAEGARRAAERAEDVLHRELVPGGMEPIVGRALEYRLRLWLETGETARAAAWLRERGISAEGELDARRLTLEVLLARTLAASGEHDAAVRVLDRVRDAAGDAPRLGLAVELGVAKALALQELRRDEEAVELLAGAVRTAEPAGYVRLFADGGAPAARLLRGAAPSLPGAGPYLRRLLLACGRGDRDGSPGAQTGLREPLNDRELALLRLFAAGRSNQEIAGELYLSVNTVKWHARNIYGKLGVNRRALAVARAKELGVL